MRYHRLFLICFVLSLFCFVLAAILFFVMDIRNVLGYLTGKYARRKIRELENAMVMKTVTEKLTDLCWDSSRSREVDGNESKKNYGNGKGYSDVYGGTDSVPLRMDMQ